MLSALEAQHLVDMENVIFESAERENRSLIKMDNVIQFTKREANEHNIILFSLVCA